MAKIIVAIDIGDVKDLNPDRTVIVNEWAKQLGEIVLRDITLAEMSILEVGATITMDPDYLARDRDDDDFFEFEFRGWEP